MALDFSPLAVLLKVNYATDKDNSDYEEDYEEPDIIIDVKDELTMFSGINKVGYAKIHKRLEDGNYELF